MHMVFIAFSFPSIVAARQLFKVSYTKAIQKTGVRQDSAIAPCATERAFSSSTYLHCWCPSHSLPPTSNHTTFLLSNNSTTMSHRSFCGSDLRVMKPSEVPRGATVKSANLSYWDFDELEAAIDNNVGEAKFEERVVLIGGTYRRLVGSCKNIKKAYRRITDDEKNDEESGVTTDIIYKASGDDAFWANLHSIPDWEKVLREAFFEAGYDKKGKKVPGINEFTDMIKDCMNSPIPAWAVHMFYAYMFPVEGAALQEAKAAKLEAKCVAVAALHAELAVADDSVSSSLLGSIKSLPPLSFVCCPVPYSPSSSLVVSCRRTRRGRTAAWNRSLRIGSLRRCATKPLPVGTAAGLPELLPAGLPKPL